MEYTNIKLEKVNSVATIRLNRPDVMNAISPDLLTEFAHALDDVRDDLKLKALVVRGEGQGLYQPVVDVLSICHRSQITNISLAYRFEGERR